METASVLPLQSGSFWVSVCIVAALVAGVSTFFQVQSAEGTPTRKTLLRDGILGAIVGALGWVLVPDSMRHMTATFEGVPSTVGPMVSTSMLDAATDLHLGNPDF
jgi:hypothetical protein